MGLLSAADIKRLEKKYAGGISSADVVDVFKGRGERFSSATLRKYVQLELLPKSIRVGEPGRHRGSAGLYPASVVRQVNEIKRALDAGASLEEIRLGALGLSGELHSLRRVAESVLQRYQESITSSAPKARRGRLGKDLAKAAGQMRQGLKALERLAQDGIGQSTRGFIERAE